MNHLRGAFNDVWKKKGCVILGTVKDVAGDSATP